jgi:hypothetical protein
MAGSFYAPSAAGRRTRLMRFAGSSPAMTARNPGLTSGLPRVVEGLLRPVITSDPRGERAEQVARKAQDQGDGIDRKRQETPKPSDLGVSQNLSQSLPDHPRRSQIGADDIGRGVGKLP